MTSILGRALYGLIPFVVFLALWCLPLIYLQRAVRRPFWLLVYMVLITVGALMFSVWWVTV